MCHYSVRSAKNKAPTILIVGQRKQEPINLLENAKTNFGGKNKNN